jgi:hypothetical protein
MQTPVGRRNPKGRQRYASHRCVAVVAQTFLSAEGWQAGMPAPLSRCFIQHRPFLLAPCATRISWRRRHDAYWDRL